MSYRFVRVTNNYPGVIKSFYSKNPDVSFKSYSEQYKQFVNYSFDIVSSYSKNLNKIGVEAFDIITNASALQNTWKKENNLRQDIASPKLIIEQLKFYKPDVVWVDDFSIIDSTWKNDLLKNVPSVKLLIGHICAPYNSVVAEKFKLFDLIFTCIPCFRTELSKLGLNTHLLYHGFEQSILNNLNDDNHYPESNFLFSGSLYTGAGFHKTRIEYIEKILEEGIKMDLYCNLETWKKVRVKKTLRSSIKLLRKLGMDSVVDKIPPLKRNKSYADLPIKYYSKKIIESSKPPVFGYEMYKLLSKTKICFNIHGEIAEKCAGNIRLFEATGVATCLLTDWKQNIADLFEPDKEVVTYKSIDECIEKVNWLTNNPIEREKIAKAGQIRTLKNHTVKEKAKLMNEIISKELYKINEH